MFRLIIIISQCNSGRWCQRSIHIHSVHATVLSICKSFGAWHVLQGRKECDAARARVINGTHRNFTWAASRWAPRSPRCITVLRRTQTKLGRAACSSSSRCFCSCSKRRSLNDNSMAEEAPSMGKLFETNKQTQTNTWRTHDNKQVWCLLSTPANSSDVKAHLSTSDLRSSFKRNTSSESAARLLSISPKKYEDPFPTSLSSLFNSRTLNCLSAVCRCALPHRRLWLNYCTRGDLQKMISFLQGKQHMRNPQEITEKGDYLTDYFGSSFDGITPFTLNDLSQQGVRMI